MTENQFITNKRIAIVDFLRGFCLLCVVISNYMAFQNSGDSSTGINRFIKITEEIFFGPVWISLSFLFGFGFWILIYKKQNSFLVFTRRMGWLFVLGIVNACLFHIDILRDFAIMGLFLFITFYFSKKTLLYLSIFLTFCIPFLRAYTIAIGLEFGEINLLKELPPLFMSDNLWDVIKYNLKYIYIVQVQNPVYLISVHYEMFCFFLWGVLASRYKVFENDKTILKIAKGVLLFSLIGTFMIWGMNFMNESIMNGITRIYNLKVVMEVLFALFVFAVITIIYLSGILKRLFSLVEIYGRMTLTNYMMQSIFSIVLFSGFGLGWRTNLPLWAYFLTAIFVYALQLAISFYWSKKYQLGPVEWLWRSLSSGKALSLLKKSA